ncbi:hypothetical protein QBC47DRAFT_352796 [Echria macrotheca]|uniref:RRM domain-containing protein n=1 Tax=Echria macrotheca TaxID=438768 RepID=A0AAJ0B5D9_9PEZI|nr:hypothetical protein QBC47DRAFT_352796 [Echria macrotheca]
MGKPATKKRQRDADEVASAVKEAIANDEPAAVAAEPTTTPRAKRARTETNKSLFVRSLPPSATADSLTEFFSQHYPVKHATVVLDPKTKTSRGYGFVSFADPEDALEAKEKLNNFLLDGRRLRLDIAQPRHRDAAKSGHAGSTQLADEKRKREEALAEARKAPKLIIRNLPWSIKTSEQLGALFRSYGKVKFADLPNDKGKLSGFGFVTLRGRKNAEKAMEAINGKTIDGRIVAVDWAVDKQTWEKQQHGDSKSDEGGEKANKKKTKPAKPKDDEDDDDEMEGMTQEDKDLAMFFKKHADDLESEEEGSDNEDEDEDEEHEEGSGSDEDSQDGGADVDEEDEFDMAEEEEKAAPRTTDNSKTVFIRNLPYTATDETLKAHFTQFGAIRYARIVMDRATDRPAGTGFVCFFNEDEFKECLKNAPRHKPAPTASKHSVLQDETADPSGKYTLDGRILQVTQAVEKEEASRLATEAVGNRKDKDKRKLFLLSEGTISSTNPLYKKLSPTEIQMREASAKQRKKMIQTNPSLHLSLTRLALRNIPRNVTSKELKALAREAIVGFAKDVKEGRRQPLSKEENSRGGPEDKEAEKRRREKGKGVVKQAKIVFESNEGTKVAESVGGKSRGYGFIEYSSHRWALMGLRYLNGHPLKNEAGKTQRLIVEFAIENANVVQRRRQMEEKRKMNPGGGGIGNGEKRGGGAKAMDGGDGGDGGKKGGPPPEKKERKKADDKLALRTKIIARKRMMRKKKAVVRGGK